MSTNIRSVRFTEAGKPADVLKVEEVPMPAPKPGEVRIRVHARPVNPSDISFIQNQYGIKPQFPSGAGFEGMGTIDAMGEGVSLKTILPALTGRKVRRDKIFACAPLNTDLFVQSRNYYSC